MSPIRPLPKTRRVTAGALSLAAGLAAGLGGLLLAAGPASAQAIDVTDATGDVQSVTVTVCDASRTTAPRLRVATRLAARRSPQDPTCAEDGYTQTVTDLPDTTVRDATSLRVSNRAHQVVLVQHYRELSKDPGLIVYSAIVRGNRGRTIATSTTRNARTGKVRTTVETVRNGKRLACKATARFDFAGDALEVRVPARCLKSPTKVQANMVAFSQAAPTASSMTIQVDGAVGSFADSFAGFSPWVARG